MDANVLVEQMGSLARDLRSQHSGQETLHHVVDSAVELIDPCEDAGISMASRHHEIRTAAATGQRPARHDRLQQELNAGPAFDAVWKERVVAVRDVSHDERWPEWASRTSAELGIGSVVCFQLFTHENRVGALQLLSSEPGAFTEDDVDAGLAVAAHAAVAVAVAAAEEIDHLHVAIDSRTVIGQATGVLMERYQLTADAAFGLLKRFSMEQNEKVALIARRLVGLHDPRPAAGSVVTSPRG